MFVKQTYPHSLLVTKDSTQCDEQLTLKIRRQIQREFVQTQAPIHTIKTTISKQISQNWSAGH